MAGQPAYKVKLSPKHDGGLLGDIQLAWDAAHGVPLGIAIYAQGNEHAGARAEGRRRSPSGAVSNGDLSIQAPSGAKTVQVSSAADRTAARRAHTPP